MLYTQDTSHGRWDLRMKLPLLVWPFIMAWIKPFTLAQMKQMWGVFLTSLVLAVFVCLGVYLRIYGKDWHDVRQTSIFISHIRFGMMLALGVAVAWYFAFDKGWKGKMLIALLVMLFVGYLAAIESLTGVLLIGVILIWNTLFQVRKWHSVVLRRVVLAAVFGIPLSIAIYVMKEASIYLEEPTMSMALLPSHSAGGEPYQAHHGNALAIRGDYVFGQIAPNELHRTWFQRTGIDAEQKDRNGFPIAATLIRYLSALRSTKDSVGVMRLSDQDIQYVLAGYTSPKHANQNGLQRRIEAIFFEIAHYKAGGDASGHSLTQRWEFWRAAKYIIAGQPWMGVGTGDTKLAFAHAYQEIQSELLPERRLRAHNQYLTQWLTFGVGGLLVLMAFLWYAWSDGRWRYTIWSSFMLIVALSFLTEDTLESQAGVTFVAFFYVWIRHHLSQDASKQNEHSV
jgi:hypothetical protein